jgi:hypothetical protein
MLKVYQIFAAAAASLSKFYNNKENEGEDREEQIPNSANPIAFALFGLMGIEFKVWTRMKN